MNATVTWSTRGLPSTSVRDAWSEKMAEVHLPWNLSFSRRDHLDATVRYRQLDALIVSEFRGGGYSGYRSTETDARRGGPRIGIMINLSGRLVCRQGDDTLILGPDQLLLWDSETAEGFEAVEPRRELSLLLPREQAPRALAEAATSGRGAVSVAAGSGLASIAADQLRAITRELDHLSDAGLAIACQSLFDTLDTALAPAGTRPAVREALLVRLRRYIEDNLDDPDLCASSVAEAHDISVRTLHLAFADTGTTVSRWIRARRLRAAYRHLTRPGSTATVTDVAFRWGFNDVAHFSRVFKQAYGATPSSVRRGSAR
ncbi:helix-turn-helix domain-containing protein [Streptomyces sp. NPDC014892]|uniref:helix-turn-helix domain-containing protein n=1 Tax=Streptomyces TaxID=1883 RepID=UPI001EFC03E1|nr:helix-turn-helix domain-containing protein [Streptomyces deccanensis]ULR55011.1 helix-turn-helix domain-containing protein [Streptomyces deccanensis]